MKELRFTTYFSERLKPRKIPEDFPDKIMKYAELRFYNRSTGRFVAIKMDTTSLKEGTLKYYENDDVLYFFLKKGIETRSVEAAPGITIELNNKNQIIGIEILDASKFIQEYIIKTFSRDLDLVDNL